ncbi:MAG: T9SS type A sorting domain-containing protein [Bacteroidales bacterium]|nr:T9SS type A sorting domain-containing protein [Bacteroidales bacterium]
MTPEVHLFGVEPVWFQIAEFERNEVPSAIEVSKDGNQVYVGMETGAVYRMDNVAVANDSASLIFDSPESMVTNDTVFFMEERMITSVSVDPNDNDHVIITLGNYGNEHYVYESFNATAENPDFTSIQYNLPLVPVYSSLVEMNSSNRILVGSEFGIFALEGNSWTLEGGDMGALPVTQLRQQVLDSETIRVPIGELGGETVYRTYKGITNNGIIFASTYGRGLWKSRNYVGVEEFENPNGEQAKNMLHVYPNPASDRATVEVGEINTEDVFLRVLDLQGRAVCEMPLSKRESGEVTFDVSYLRSGQYLLQIVEGSNVKTGKLIIR